MQKLFCTGLIYRNPSPHVSSKQAYFPSVVSPENRFAGINPLGAEKRKVHLIRLPQG